MSASWVDGGEYNFADSDCFLDDLRKEGESHWNEEVPSNVLILTLL